MTAISVQDIQVSKKKLQPQGKIYCTYRSVGVYLSWTLQTRPTSTVSIVGSNLCLQKTLSSHCKSTCPNVDYLIQ